MNKVRVRFAPSPTGPLHIGGVRTALFNYLFAKKNQGDFLLRIEDTDQTRFVEGAEAYIEEALNWCNIQIDEGVKQGGEYGPYKQSERRDIYNEYIQKLIDSGNAYYAFDTPEELNKLRQEAESKKETFAYDYNTRKGLRNSINLSEDECKSLLDANTPYVIRFKIPEDVNVSFSDMIRKDVTMHTSTLDDKVLVKTDGLPTYHLANVVDDHLMRISHVIRGEEWLPSTPLHILLYKAFGWEDTMPQFAHLPLILKPNGKGKLSKRDGDQMGFPVFPLEWKDPKSGDIASGYRESGYLSDGFINFLALLGWNPGTEQELFTLNDLCESFDLSRVNKSGSKFDPEKAKWFNQQYIKQVDDSILGSNLIDIAKSKGIEIAQETATKVIGLVKERLVLLSDIWDQVNFFFERPQTYDAKVIKKKWKENTPEILANARDFLKSQDDFSSTMLEDNFKKYLEDNEIGFGQIMNAFRLVLVGAGKGPHLFDICEILGKDEVIERIEIGINTIKK